MPQVSHDCIWLWFVFPQTSFHHRAGSCWCWNVLKNQVTSDYLMGFLFIYFFTVRFQSAGTGQSVIFVALLCFVLWPCQGGWWLNAELREDAEADLNWDYFLRVSWFQVLKWLTRFISVRIYRCSLYFRYSYFKTSQHGDVDDKPRNGSACVNSCLFANTWNENEVNVLRKATPASVLKMGLTFHARSLASAHLNRYLCW